MILLPRSILISDDNWCILWYQGVKSSNMFVLRDISKCHFQRHCLMIVLSTTAPKVSLSLNHLWLLLRISMDCSDLFLFCFSLHAPSHRHMCHCSAKCQRSLRHVDGQTSVDGWKIRSCAPNAPAHNPNFGSQLHQSSWAVIREGPHCLLGKRPPPAPCSPCIWQRTYLGKH